MPDAASVASFRASATRGKFAMCSLIAAVSFLVLSAQAVSAQDAFYGADTGSVVVAGVDTAGDSFSYSGDAFAGSSDRRTGTQTVVNEYSPRLRGSTNGTLRSYEFSSAEIRKIAQFQANMDAALKAGKLSDFALNAYRMGNLTRSAHWQKLGDLATGETSLDDVDVSDLGDEKEMVKAILEAQGKGDQYIRFLEQRAEESEEGERDLVDARVDGISGKQTPDEKKLADAGLRRFRSPLLRVYINDGHCQHEKMARRCFKRSLDQVCAATGNALKYKFVDYENEANIVIGFDHRAWLWYEYQRHSTSIVAEPPLGVNIDRVKMKLPLMATMHRMITERECQEFCLRELPRALGYAWHPVSLERFNQDFRTDIAWVRKHDRAAPTLESLIVEESNLSGPERVRQYVQHALYATKQDFYYYAGMAYLTRGDLDMARRYFCNATTALNFHTLAMRNVLNRFIGQGDVLGAELIAFACINDNEDNDPDNAPSQEYNRVKRLNQSDSSRQLPTLARTESQMMARLYPGAVAADATKPVANLSR
jgi:hypothetical protein